MMNSLNVIGIGLDGLEGLGEKAREKIDQATIMVGSSRHLSYLKPSWCRHILLDDIFKGK